MLSAFQIGIIQADLGQVDPPDFSPLVSDAATLVAEDATDTLVAVPTNLRELPWLLSWLDAVPPDAIPDYWRPLASIGALDIGPALVAGSQLLTGWLSAQSDGVETIEIAETHPAAQFITISPPAGSTFVQFLNPFSQFVLDGGYLYEPNFQMMNIHDQDGADLPGVPQTVTHPGYYDFDPATKTFEFFPGITGNIILRYQVTIPASFALHLGVVEAVDAGNNLVGNYRPQYTPWDGSTWAVTEAGFWTLAGAYLQAAPVVSFGGPAWALVMPSKATLGGNDWVVLRLIATPPGRAPIRMYFLLAAPA